MTFRAATACLFTAVVGACVSGGGGGVDNDAALQIDAATDAAPPPIDAPPPPTPEPLERELGHVTEVVSIQHTASRVLTVDSSGHWALWDSATRALVTKGDRACPVGQACQVPAALLAGDTVLVRGVPALEVRSATTGAVVASIPSQVGLDTPGSGVAADGSYVWATTSAAVRAWSPAGQARVNVAGNFLAADVFAAAGELRIAHGPAGPGLIEHIDVATSARTTVAHDGTFARWFLDGARFLTTSGNLVRVYDAAGGQVAAAVLPGTAGLDGQGDHVWTTANGLTVYRVPDLTTPVKQMGSGPGPSAANAPGAIGVLGDFFGELRVVRLDTLAVIPVEDLPCGLSAFDASETGWMLGTRRGAVLRGHDVVQDRPLARGQLLSLSGTVGGEAAIASAAGVVELVEVDDTPVVVRTLPYLSSHVELSTDGATLLATEDLSNVSCRPALPVRMVSTATGAVLHAWPYGGAAHVEIAEISVARTALTLAHLRWIDGSYARELTTSTGADLPGYGPPLTYDASGVGGLHLFAPGGQRAAILAGYTSLDQAYTYLYDGGVQRALVDGLPLGWLDDDRLLIVRYTRNGNQFVPTTTVRHVDGTVVATLPLPELGGLYGLTEARVRGHVTPAGQGQLYARRKNTVYDQATGAPVWSGPINPLPVMPSEVAGDHVLYVQGTELRVERFRP